MAKKSSKQSKSKPDWGELQVALLDDMERSRQVTDHVAKALSDIARSQYPRAKFWQPRQTRGLAALISRHAHDFGLALANLDYTATKDRP